MILIPSKSFWRDEVEDEAVLEVFLQEEVLIQEGMEGVQVDIIVLIEVEAEVFSFFWEMEV